jgi:hypothetical protein
LRKNPPDYGYVAEHRMVMENTIKRILNKGECVHHLDGNKSNNEINNLLLCHNNKEHSLVHQRMETFVEKLIRENKVYYDNGLKEFKFRSEFREMALAIR